MIPKQELYKCSHTEMWRREIGDISPYAFTHRIGGSLDLIQRLKLYHQLDGHDGCVNTVHFNPSGEILVSGSDDRQIIFWDWAANIQKLSYASGHESNVFQARVMPFSDDRSVVSCAADGQVRHAMIRDDGSVDTKKLAKHQGRAHKLAIEPGSSRLFYSCGEDGVVQHFDLRSNKSTKLFRCVSFQNGTASKQRRRPSVVRLNAIILNPRNPHYFAVGGSDEYARVYDIRKTCAASDMGDNPVGTFTPKHLIGSHQVHITCVAYSLQEELLVSYNDEHIYLFEKGIGLGPNPRTAHLENTDISQEEPQVYKGHRNAQTVKGVNFFGPNTEYVVSGSDCGHVFIWKKKGGELVHLMLGDEQVVNCLEPHPHATILATSGIDSDIKIWTPTAEELTPVQSEAEKIMEANKSAREEQAPFALTPDIIMHVLQLQQHTRRMSRTRQSEDEDEDDIDGGDRDKAADGDTSSDESQDNSQVCIVS